MTGLPDWLRQILTGANNETVAIGRFMGLIVFVLFVVGLPLAACLTLIKGWVPASEWGLILDKLPIYLSLILLSVGGLIGLTSPSEPKAPRPPLPPQDGGN